MYHKNSMLCSCKINSIKELNDQKNLIMVNTRHSTMLLSDSKVALVICAKNNNL